MYVDEEQFSNFVRDFGSEENKGRSKPYELKHTFDFVKNEYVTNELNCCYFTPVSNLDNIIIESSNPTVVRVTKDYIICDNRGTCELTIKDKKGNTARKPLLVTVYIGNLVNDRKRKSIFLKKDTLVEKGNFLRHCHCTHLEDCLFQREVFDTDLSSLGDKIWSVRKAIKDLEYVKDSYRNGDIIYHPSLDDCYNIQLKKKSNTDGVLECVTSVSVSDNFVGRVKSEIKSLNIQLRDLNRLKRSQ